MHPHTLDGCAFPFEIKYNVGETSMYRPNWQQILNDQVIQPSIHMEVCLIFYPKNKNQQMTRF